MRPADKPDLHPPRAPDFATAQFLTGAHRPDQFPPDQGAEAAFAGRSNSGKSSALNTLTRHKLARISKAPGRTRLLNFFDCGGGRRLVDLPGYGYAQVPGALREHWGRTIHHYLEERHCLKGMVLTMDCRRPLLALDRQLLAWCGGRALPVHILLTKSDKLSRGQAQAALLAVRREAEDNPLLSVQLFSSLKRQGRDEVLARLSAWLDGD